MGSVCRPCAVLHACGECRLCTRSADTASAVQSLEAERAAAIIAALQQEAADIRAEQQRQAATQTQQLDAERAAKQRLERALTQAQVPRPGAGLLACLCCLAHWAGLRMKPCRLDEARLAVPGGWPACLQRTDNLHAASCSWSTLRKLPG